MSSDLSKRPVDAVITWVDGGDPAHRAKLNAYLESIGHRPKSASATRFSHMGELDYCIESLVRFAPWLRYIHIVTDEQTPQLTVAVRQSEWADRVRVVDHKQIFRGFEDCLPTFNSVAIETMLWRIPDLAEQFLYLNDDFMLLRPLKETDFFRDGRPVLRGHWNLLPRVRLDKLLLRKLSLRGSESTGSRFKNREAQARGAQLAGMKCRYLRVPHNPHALLKSSFEEFNQSRPDLVRNNIEFRLRSEQQYQMDAVARHLDLRAGRALIDNRLKTLRLKAGSASSTRLMKRLAWADASEDVAFACIQSLDTASPDVQASVLAWLDSIILGK